MRHRAFLHLVASVLASLPFAASAFADAGLQVSGPIVHDNLAIYLVHGTAAGGAVPLTLQEALAKGAVKVHETGSVNALTVENSGKDEVYVQAGDIVKGGQQDRVLSVDLLLPPRSGEVSIAAFCVEHGRWTARGNEDVRQFSSAASAMPSHEAKVAMRAYAVTAAAPAADASASTMAYAGGAGVGESQQEIWSTVRKTQDSLSRSVGALVAAPASPSSLQLSLENEKLKQAQTAYIAALQGAGANRRRYRRLRICHQRQDQQRRRLRLERAVSQNVEQAACRQCHRGDQRERGSRCGAAVGQGHRSLPCHGIDWR